MTGAEPVPVRILLRPDCHLCHEAERQIEAILGTDPVIRVERVDIESDPELFKRNLERIPVVEIDGEVVSQLEFDRDAFVRALEAARESTGR